MELVPKDIPSIDFEFLTIFTLKDGREGDDLIFTGIEHSILSGSMNERIIEFFPVRTG